MRQITADAVERLLTNACPPKAVRAIERGEPYQTLWETMESSGFVDALVPEHAGGAGFSLTDASPVLELSGRHAVPLPLAESMLLRALIHSAGAEVPGGPLTFGRKPRLANGAVTCANVPCGKVADWVAVPDNGSARIMPVAAAEAAPCAFALDATLSWPRAAWDRTIAVDLNVDLHLVEALIRAAQLSGALQAVFGRTLDYANQRQQFGKAIGKFQAIQHQLAVMSEHVIAARMSAEMAVAQVVIFPDPLRVGIAKARASAAAVEVAALAHSIHGAIGFTAEYDLQLWTRRLHAWRQSAGTEGFWFARVGKLILDHYDHQSLDLLREATALA
jgi:acyl-CoA dehydrogenase